jgi:hypothetical protein
MATRLSMMTRGFPSQYRYWFGFFSYGFLDETHDLDDKFKSSRQEK